MSRATEARVDNLSPDDIVPGDPETTLWNWSVRNNLPFVPSVGGGDVWVHPYCAWKLVCPHNAYSSAKTGFLVGIPRTNGLIRLRDVMSGTSNERQNS